MIVSLDGEWLLATDPTNVGRDQRWWEGPRPDTKPAKVPWIIQDAFPGYHGVAWYWREVMLPPNPHRDGRYLLRFWAVDYKADVWVNDVHVGEHEGGETPFVLDATEALRQVGNLSHGRVAVRVLNPTNEPIDGIVLNETAHRNKVVPYGSGSAWDQGGIIDSVELRVAPPVRVEDLFVRPDWKTGAVRAQVNVRNALPQAAQAHLELSVAPAASGETVTVATIEREVQPGDTLVEAELKVDKPHLWSLSDPFLYRVTARVSSDGSVGADGSVSADEHSVRCGFRDFRFEDGWFRLNGKRLCLRCSHTGNCCPVGLLMAYEEAYASWCLADSPKMGERFDESLLGMVRRDRNHPSVTIWGLLNETPDGAVFRHAVDFLPNLRALDDSRLVMLNSGRWNAARRPPAERRSSSSPTRPTCRGSTATSHCGATTR